MLQSNNTHYEGIATTITLKTEKDKVLSVMGSFNMWGDHALDANDKAIYSKLNSA